MQENELNCRVKPKKTKNQVMRIIKQVTYYKEISTQAVR